MAEISKVQFFRDTTPLVCRRCPYLKEHWIADGHPTVRCSSIGKRVNRECPVFEGIRFSDAVESQRRRRC